MIYFFGSLQILSFFLITGFFVCAKLLLYFKNIHLKHDSWQATIRLSQPSQYALKKWVA